MGLAILQHINHAAQIMLDELTAAESGLSAGQHAGIGRGVDHPIHRRQHFKIARHADIAMQQRDS